MGALDLTVKLTAMNTHESEKINYKLILICRKLEGTCVMPFSFVTKVKRVKKLYLRLSYSADIKLVRDIWGYALYAGRGPPVQD